MYRWLLGDWRTVGFVAITTVLIYVSTVGAIRASGRRTLAEMSAFDFVVAVAMGGIVARTATLPSPSYVQGLAAVLTLVAVHRGLGWARLHWTPVRWLLDRDPVVLARDGHVCPDALSRVHLSEEEVAGVVREHGLPGVQQTELVVMEADGRFSVIAAGGLPAWEESTGRRPAGRDRDRKEHEGMP
jgi:uncharacterized membrane protein YcaP (DUF421 family)